MPTEDIVVVGRIGSPYGVQGWVHLQSFTDPPENLLDYQPWYVMPAAGAPSWQLCGTAECRPHKQAFIAKLQGCDDRDRAAALSGHLIGVGRDQLPRLRSGEFYWRDLIGMQVRNTQGELLGTVARILETGAHDVLEVKQEGAEQLIPFVAPYLLTVDEQTREILVDWQQDW